MVGERGPGRARPAPALRPHLLGIDDGPFTKGQREPVSIVGVTMAGHDRVEAVARTRFAVDAAGVSEFLADWVRGLRVCPSLQGIVLGGITIAGLAVVDVPALARALGLPVLVVNRRDPGDHALSAALEAAGLSDRQAIVERTPPAFEVGPGLWLACAGCDRERARSLVESALGKSRLPEPLRVAHLVARAIEDGESRGRA